MARAPSTVLMTADTLGGVLTYAIDLARGLATHGVRVALATMGAPLSDAQRREVAAAPSLAVFESAYRLEWMDDPWDDVAKAGDWLLSLEARIRPDVVHVNGVAHAALPFRAPTIAVVHSCVLSWWEAVRAEAAPAAYDRYRREVRAGLAAADTVVAPTRAMLDAAARLYGSFGRAYVIPNAADPRRHAPHEKEEIILAVGRIWDDAKNIAALDRVSGRVPWPIVVAGSAYHPDHGPRTLAGVHALGSLARAEVAGWMARAAIYALPARYEPFGLSALEAALSECALVLGDIPSLREVWGDRAAIFVDPNSDAQIEAALRALVASPDLRRRLGEEARARALAYAPLRMTRRYLDVYAEILEGRRASMQSPEGRCA